MPSYVECMVSTGAVKVITEIIKVKKLPKLKDELRNKLSLCNGWSSAIPLHPLSRTDQILGKQSYFIDSYQRNF